MKIVLSKKSSWIFLIIPYFVLSACSSSGNPINMKNSFIKGNYGYDVAFFSDNNIKTIELKDEHAKAGVLIVPEYQGRVMTSTADGEHGKSFGWINYKLIESGETNSQFNPYGGEERLWFGPEGGPFSIYFRKGDEQVFSNWQVPKELDTEPFEITEQTESSAGFTKSFSLPNAAGNILDVRVDRFVKLLTLSETENALDVTIDPSLSVVGYESANTLTNTGKDKWTEESGALSIWILAMFNPSEQGLVFIPYKKGDESERGKIVTDDYFGKVPSDRLKIGDGIIFFKTDGKFRSKIGISPQRALPVCGSYDPENKVITLLWYSLPEKPLKYVNSKWGPQDDPFVGDVVNSYNDGPVEDGSIMGPFYEIESSSPAAFLNPQESITHTQRIFHISGDEAKLNLITRKIFNLTIDEIKEAFN
jgi:hypothetical protein